MTESEQVIKLALVIIEQATRSIASANIGDVATARAQLDKARNRYDAALAGWDAAGQKDA